MGDGEGGGPNELSAVVGPFWSEAKVCAALDVTRAALDDRCVVGEVLRLVTADAVSVYPVWQFHRRSDGAAEVKPAVAPVFRLLRRHDPWAVAVLLHTRSPELDGLSPLEWLVEVPPVARTP
ncbi:hypothetical protein [Nocardioides dongkuii]|uniref:hypothetical protein n=1 Tax=Nocardioides dongkuii TaxID=2760089 RepID=UPI0015FD93A2|nr:hypothetical protein [Nocardioides dongkuii]